MRIAKLSFLGFIATLILGCASCVPGICGCAFSLWPATWEEAVTLPAIAADLIGLTGALVSAIVILILWTRRKTIQTAEAE